MKPKEHYKFNKADKFERAEMCYNKLQSQDYKLCFKDGTEITSYKQIEHLSIGKPSIDSGYREYCLEKLSDEGVIQCHLVSHGTHAGDNTGEL
jgi:hypothetical protein